MRIKKLLAMLLAAAMALTLFAGCCSPSLLRLLLELLQDQYQNITVTAEDDLDATLRQAVSENDTFEDITAALAQALDKTVEFESLRSARAGDQTFSLVYRTGTDTQAIARQTYTDWNKILGSLPTGGRYLADLAVRKSGGGYYILVNVTVQKGSSSGGSGSHDGGSGGDDENGGGGQTQPDPLPDYEWKGKNVIQVHTNTGLQNVFFDQMDSDQDLMTARADGFDGVTIQLDKLENNETYTVDKTFETDFDGTLTSTDTNSDDTVATIQLSDQSMFKIVGGTISHIDFVVTGVITSGLERYGCIVVGAVASQNSGTIAYCNVEFVNDAGIEITYSGSGSINIGGITGLNQLASRIEYCNVDGGLFKIDVEKSIVWLYVGGITGQNQGWGITEQAYVADCDVSNSRMEVNLSNGVKVSEAVLVGGVIGLNSVAVATRLTTNSENQITVTYNGQPIQLDKNNYNETHSVKVGEAVGFQQ